MSKVKKFFLSTIIGLTIGHATWWGIYFLFWQTKQIYQLPVSLPWWIFEIIAVIMSIVNIILLSR